jgi:myosin heavy subunit
MLFIVMKLKIGLALLALLALGLAIALITSMQVAAKHQETDAATILDFSNQWSRASLDNNELHQVNLALNSDLATNRSLLLQLSNHLAELSVTLTNTRATLQTAEDQVAAQTRQIADLQAQNKALDEHGRALTEQAASLTNTIARLNDQIADTMRQLALSKTNNASLEQQLQHLIMVKAELEHKFNTLAAVHDQFKKLHAEMVMARRLHWQNEGTATPLKGAELLSKWRNTPLTNAEPKIPAVTNFCLNVEIGSDCSVRSLPPGTRPSTNGPAVLSTNQPAK